MYTLKSELTPFYDRNGKNHWRLLKATRFFILAYLYALIHCDFKPYGSVLIIKDGVIFKRLYGARR